MSIQWGYPMRLSNEDIRCRYPMGISNGDIQSHSEGSFLHHHPCIILQDSDIFTPGVRHFSLRMSSEIRAANGWKQSDSCCAPVPVHLHCKVSVYIPCGSWIPWPVFQAIFARCNVLQTQSARGKLISSTLTQLDLSTGLEMKVASFGR